jgi:hypothetical protein
MLASAINLNAFSYNDSIVNIPKGTIFQLKYELEVPTNQNFLLLGQNYTQEYINQFYQPLNQQNDNYSMHQTPTYITYDNFITLWRDNIDKSYNNCIQRHKVYYSYGSSTPSSTNNNIIVNNSYGNTNVVINNNIASTEELSYGSYIQQNSCIKPEHTITALMLNTNKTKSGGIFREDYQFKVSKVRSYHNGHFYIIDIVFDHNIAKGIRIVTTTPPKYIPIRNLKATNQNSSGFWNNLGAALNSITNIGGDFFDINFPKTKYFD